MWGDIAIAFMIAFMTSFMMTPQTIKMAKKLGAVDTPKDERRINKVPMPRLGGLAVIAGFLMSIIYLLIVMTIEGNIHLTQEHYHTKLLGFAIGGLLICLVCFYDDIKGVKAVIKLMTQILAAIIVVKAGIMIDSIDIPFVKIDSNNQLFYQILTICWIIGITNAMNLIDGLDGLSTGISIISCGSLLIIFSLNRVTFNIHYINYSIMWFIGWIFAV